MSNNNATAFAEYLQSLVKLETLEKITQDLDEELADSQRVMREIKSMFDSIPTADNPRQEDMNNVLRHEELSRFLEAGVPKIIMADMTETPVEVDIDNIISSIKTYAEDLKQNFVPMPASTNVSSKEIQSINFEEYASSLDQLSKRLANIKLNKGETDNRNMELETKLGQLCQDVDLFTQMVQAKTTLNSQNEKWKQGEPIDLSSLRYDGAIEKLLSGINEVTYLLRNKN